MKHLLTLLLLLPLLACAQLGTPTAYFNHKSYWKVDANEYVWCSLDTNGSSRYVVIADNKFKTLGRLTWVGATSTTVLEVLSVTKHTINTDDNYEIILRVGGSGPLANIEVLTTDSTLVTPLLERITGANDIAWGFLSGKPQLIVYKQSPTPLTRIYPCQGTYVPVATVREATVEPIQELAYPNPTTGEVQIPARMAGMATVLDVAGNEVQRWPVQPAQGHATLSLDKLAAGQYIVRMPEGIAYKVTVKP